MRDDPTGRPLRPAVVVPVFRPDDDVVARLAELARQAPVVAVDGGSPPGYEPVLEKIDELADVRLIRRSRNAGIAAVLNAGLDAARAAGATVVVTFDQDSSPRGDHVAKLVKVLESDLGSPVGLIGPGVIEGIPMHRAAGHPSAVVQVDSTYQSGAAIPVTVFDRVGGFDESLFIDGVDTDFCLRLQRAGLSVLVVPELSMGHRWGLGSDGSRRFKLGRYRPAATGHSADRRYYINRNAVILLRRHGRARPRWAMTFLRRLLAADILAVTLEDARSAKLAAMLQGLGHGLRGRHGPRPGVKA